MDPKIKDKIDEIVKYKNNSTMLKIKSENINLYKYILEEKFLNFYDEYPTLFKMIIGDEDISMLYQMIDMKNKIDNNEIDKHDGEVILGELLANKYLYPKLKK